MELIGCGFPLLAIEMTIELPPMGPPTPPRLFGKLDWTFGGDCKFGLLLPNPIPIVTNWFLFPC